MSSLPGAVNPCDFLYKLASQRSMPPPTFEQVNECKRVSVFFESRRSVGQLLNVNGVV